MLFARLGQHSPEQESIFLLFSIRLFQVAFRGIGLYLEEVVVFAAG